MNAVKQDGNSIRFIKDPSKEVQLAAVNNENGYAIKFIEDPSATVVAKKYNSSRRQVLS